MTDAAALADVGLVSARYRYASHYRPGRLRYHEELFPAPGLQTYCGSTSRAVAVVVAARDPFSHIEVFMSLQSPPMIDPNGSRATPDLAAEFKDAMRQNVSAVAVVTTWLDDRPWGMTVSAFSSICMDPPTVMTCLRRNTASAEVITAQGEFGINLLAAHQIGISERCSAPGSPKFVDDHLADGRHTVPALTGARMFLDCAVSGTVDVGDHRVFFGTVRALSTGDPNESALVYSQGGYRHNSFDHSIATGCI